MTDKSVLVVGSIAFDSIETPSGKVEEELGGSATHFSCAARFFSPVRLVGVVGQDFPATFRGYFDDWGIDTEGLSVVEGETFRWSGRYEGAMNEAETLEVHLNVLGSFEPKIPPSYRDTPFVFLANGTPQGQHAVLDQMAACEFSVMDTMNLWISTEKEALSELIQRVDCIVHNEEEAKLLTGAHSSVGSGRRIQQMGPRNVVIKKGEHGSLLFRDDAVYPVPGFPLETVVDPTGAGDTFAAGFVSSLARQGEVTTDTLRHAMLNATVMSSYNVEDFGLRRIMALTTAHVASRYGQLVELITPVGQSSLVS